jgi:hypothetical protein
MLNPIWTYGVHLGYGFHFQHRNPRTKALRKIVDALWYVPNTVIRRDLRTPKVYRLLFSMFLWHSWHSWFFFGKAGGGVQDHTWGSALGFSCCSGRRKKKRAYSLWARSRHVITRCLSKNLKHCFLFKLCDVFVLMTFHFENMAIFSNYVFDIVPTFIWVTYCLFTWKNLRCI